MSTCQFFCSPSRALIGACTRKQGCRLAGKPPPWPESLGPRIGPLTLDDTVGAYHDDCEECDRRRREIDVDPFSWGPLPPWCRHDGRNRVYVADAG